MKFSNGLQIKQQLADNQLTIGSWITIGHPAIGEIMAQAGFDWLTIDMEHSAISFPDALNLMQAISISGVCTLVRVGANDPLIIKRVMDSGAHGVIVPMVNSKEDALRAVSSVKYPPKGTRGVGLSRAQGYGFSFESYKEQLNDCSIVIAQIEHINAINNLEEILSVDGIDGTIVGPYDLSGSLGFPGEFTRPDVRDAIEKYEAVCQKMKKPMGFHVVQPDIDTVDCYKNRGYTFLAIGLDTLYLGEKCRGMLHCIKNTKIGIA